jgi:phosphatidylserine/phosphatidylglycerophosphate/cardiolipin synthase-like enzyme
MVFSARYWKGCDAMPLKQRMQSVFASIAVCVIACTPGIIWAQQSDAREVSPRPEPHVDVFFSPEDDVSAKIVAAISRARKEIRVQAYLFTSRKLANALIRAHTAGVDVAVIVDQEQFEKGGTPSVAALVAAHVPVHLDGQHGAAHNKIILIDAESEMPVVITGSYNFTLAAQTKNAENLLIITGVKAVARGYLENWARHRDHSRPIQ